MIDNLKKILNEDQDPVAIDKITAKLHNLLMKNEDIGYIAVQKKPAITLFPESVSFSLVGLDYFYFLVLI